MLQYQELQEGSKVSKACVSILSNLYLMLGNYRLDKSWLVFGGSLKSFVWEFFFFFFVCFAYKNMPNTLTEYISSH